MHSALCTLHCVLCTLQTALVAAVLNIQIPLELGNMVQVVAVLAPGQSLDTYIDRLAGPGLRLCLLYITQVLGHTVNNYMYLFER